MSWDRRGSRSCLRTSVKPGVLAAPLRTIASRATSASARLSQSTELSRAAISLAACAFRSRSDSHAAFCGPAQPSVAAISPSACGSASASQQCLCGICQLFTARLLHGVMVVLCVIELTSGDACSRGIANSLITGYMQCKAAAAVWA